MKTTLRSAFFFRPSSFPALLTALTLCLTALPSRAQADSPTLSAAEFQRMVYSAHLLTQLAEKPELDASLQVLLELQRRNPHADPGALANVCSQALARYRTNAPAYIRTNGFRDEILATYLDAFRQVPARTNFVTANLSLLNILITRAQAPTTEPQADMIHSGSQSLLQSEGDLAQSQALLDACTERAQGHAGFRATMDALLLPETLVSLDNTPAEIINIPNSALHDNPTMQTLLALSAASGDGSLTVSSNQLMTLFSGETQTFWDTINTNLALQQEINLAQPDLLSYLTNQPAINANAERLAAVKQGQARKIAAATAAVLVQSKLMEAKDPLIKLPDQMLGCLEGLHKITDGLAAFSEKDVTKLARVAASGNMLAGGLELFNLLTGGESVEDAMAREIGNVKTLIGDLSTNMNYRFDRVDQSLTQIFDTLNERFDQVEITLNAQGRQIAHLNGDVDQIRLSLLDVHTDLFRIERNLATFHALDWRFDLLEDMNLALGYEARVGTPMAYDLFTPSYVGMENIFFTHAYNRAASETLSRYTTLPYGDEYFYYQLSPGGATNVYAETLNYIKKCLRQRLLLTGFPEQPILVNPQDWSAGAAAWLQLAVENPGLFRRYERDVGFPSRLDGIISKGRDLTNFFRSLTFTGTNINWPLYDAVQNFYVEKLPDFTSQVGPLEQQYASATNFALDTWRQWDVAAPRVTAATTVVLLSPPPRNLIAGGGYHSLVLKADGRVGGWGDNTYGQTTIPTSATNVVTIAAGGSHSLAVKANRTVIAWGDNTYGQITIPAGGTNVIAVSAGHYHSLALAGNGTVVAWGAGTYNGSFPHLGQSLVPSDATNITAIAGGGYHSLALRADGTLLAWGLNNEGQLNIPANATNVIAIAAGHGHNLVLKEDGTLVAWGNNLNGSTDVPPEATNIVAIAAAGWHCLAQRADGTVLSWGRNDLGQTAVPPSLGNVHMLAAGLLHSLALKADGSVVGWGCNDQGQAIPRGWLASPRVRAHLAAGENTGVALRADGSVVVWGDSSYHQYEIPASAINVVAIAANQYHSLALKADSTVIGWGYDTHGQLTIPTTATNVVAVSAGERHTLALKADGTVLGWGWNVWGQATVPPSATNVVAIAAGYDESVALRADGTVISWGYADTIPASVTNVVAIAAGYYHQLALKADGTVVGWGAGGDGQITIPAQATNVVAIAVGDVHSLALRADGTVVGWGYNAYGQATIPAGLTNVVAIAAGWSHSLALKADGTVVGWGRNNYLQIAVPATVIDVAAWGEYPACFWNSPLTSSPIAAVTAGSAHNLALTSSGSVVAWGLNTWGQTNVPLQAQSGIRAVASGLGHNLVLASNGSALAWGLNDFGQANVPASAQSGVLAISAGSKHNLALKTDGTVIGWGYNAFGQTNISAGATNVVAIAAGCAHSLALKANGAVVAWGGNSWGQTNVPREATNGVMAIAAGRYHNLALTSGGRVLAWGLNSSGQTNVPPEAQSGMVAIAAGITHSVALKADGTVVVWGSGPAVFVPPQAWSNIVAIAAGDQHSVLLRANTSSDNNGVQTLSFARAQIPAGVAQLFRGVNDYLIAELGRVGPLQTAGTELSGAKALLQAVLELGMPYTLERDDVLHGFLYGSESLVDLAASRTFLEAENAKLQARPDAKAQVLTEAAVLRYQRFVERLGARLNDLAATGQPELPRLVGQTLRLLNLLRDAWASVPPPALEIGRETNTLRLVLYGEPYARYTLQYRDSLSVPDWYATGITNLHNEEFITPPVSGGAQRYYRGLLPVP